MKRIAIYLDGTWNDPDNNTNVWRMKLATATADDQGIEQITYYDTGVGTGLGERFLGGAFGRGLSKNVREAYSWLVEHYDDDDQIFIFGFSRGAYTARSLAGMISRCGLIDPGSPLTIQQLFDRYTTSALPLYTLQYLRRKNPTRNFDLDDEWLLKYSRKIDIDFIGVWDTVGALGIPYGKIPGISRKALPAHFIRPSKRFKRYYHALAIDEHRAPYRASLWTEFDDTDEDDTNEVSIKDEDREQRWFIGAHANVGGGYSTDPLALIPLHWMQQKAMAAGLKLRREIKLDGNEHMFPVADSFSKFLFGAYKILKFGRKYYRVIDSDDREVTTKEGKPGISRTINETIDESVFKRWADHENYRPENLIEWAKRRGKDPDTLQ